MLWLIWIAIMLLTPVCAGIGVWREAGAAPRDAAGAGGEGNQGS